MKYRQINKKENCYLDYSGNQFFLYLKDLRKLVKISDSGDIEEDVTFFDMKNTYRFVITNKNIIVSFKDSKTIFYSYIEEEFILDKQLDLLFTKENDIYIYIYNDSNLYRYNKKDKKIDAFSILEDLMFVGLDNDILIFRNSSCLYIFIDNITKIDFLWQKDISELTQYTEWDGSHEEGNIRQVYAYEDSIIVITQVFIVRINAQTGSIIYSLRLPTGLMSLSINGNRGYGCYGYHYMEIDLNKGELLNYLRIENAIYEGKEYNATMNKATFHNGYVFHGLRFEGGRYAVGAINVLSGEREWLDLLSVNMVEKIQFHKDKMFISDSGGNLFIYEKESIIK